MPTRRRLAPVGCKMNDAGYPFRGEYKVDPSMNHGHSGVASAKKATSLYLSITGSNIRIERMQTSREQTLKCELGVENDTPRAVSFPTGTSSVQVPGDGRDYHLLASVHSASSRHVCHLVLNGSEGCSTLRLRAPLDPRVAAAIVLTCDGVGIAPENGWYAIPIQSRNVAIDVVPSVSFPVSIPASVPAPVADATPPAGFTLQCVPGDDESAVLRCAGSGAAVALVPYRPVAVGAASGPFTVQLPRAAPRAEPAVPPIALETRLNPPPAGGDSAAPPVFAATAHGFRVELFGDNGASAAGEGSAALRLPDHAAHCVSMTLRDASGRPVLRHAHAVTATPSSPPLPRAIPASITTEIPAATKEPAAVPVVSPFAPPPPPPATTAIATPPDAEPLWVAQLAAAISAPDADTARRTVQSIAAPTPHAAAIIGFVSGELLRAPPVLSFDCAADALTNVRCAGHRVTAAADGEAPGLLADGGGARGAPGASVTLSASAPGSSRTALSVRARLPRPEPSADAILVARITDACERRAGDRTALAAELSGAALAADLSASGARLLRLLSAAVAPPPIPTAGQQTQQQPQFQPQQQFQQQQPQQQPQFQPQQPQQQFQPQQQPQFQPQQPQQQPPQFQPQQPEQPRVNSLAGALVDAYFAAAPPPLRDRWGAVATRLPEERALVELLLQLLRDHDSAVARAAGQSHALPECVELVVEAGVVREVRTRVPRHLSADVDGTGFAQLTQGGRVPQAYALAAGAPHVVHIVARDPATGASCAELRVTLPGEPAGPAAVAPPAAPGTFFDAAIARVSDADAQLRLTCAPHLRVHCELDGAPAGPVAAQECVLRASAARPHAAHVRLLGAAGECVFEQRLSLPPLAAPRWDVAVAEAEVRVAPLDAAGGPVAVSVDRAPERDTSGEPLALDMDEPHVVRLCRYAEGTCVGELLLRLPAFVGAQEVRDVARAYRSAHAGDELRGILKDIRARTSSAVLRELLVALMDAEASTSAAGRGTGSGTGRTAQMGEPRIHFRLSGDEGSASTLFQQGRSGRGKDAFPR